jgi:uncharacterized protein HemX
MAHKMKPEDDGQEDFVNVPIPKKLFMKFFLWALLSVVGVGHVGGSWWQGHEHTKQLSDQAGKLDEQSRTLATQKTQIDDLQRVVTDLRVRYSECSKLLNAALGCRTGKAK